MATKKSSHPVSHYDGAGHLNPKIAADLKEKIREQASHRDTDRAFVPEGHAHEELAERQGETAVRLATSGGEPADDEDDERGALSALEETESVIVETLEETDIGTKNPPRRKKA